MYQPSIANIVTKTVSLTSTSATTTQLVPALAGHIFCVCSTIMSSNDTTTRIVGLQDDFSTPIYFGYVGASLSAVIEFSTDVFDGIGVVVPRKTQLHGGVQVNFNGLTAGKTIEVSVSGFYMVQQALAPFRPFDLPSIAMWLRADRGIGLSNTLRATGTAPPVATISGTPTATTALHIEIQSAGTLGNATFRWSTDKGVTYVQSGLITQPSMVLGTTGITVAFPAGTYSADNKYDAVVSSWADQSGHGNNATQVTESRKNLLSFSALPGQPTVTVDANINGIIECDSLATSFTGLNKPCTAVAVIRVTDNARAGALLAFADVGPAEMRYEVTTATGKLRAQRAPDAGGLTTVTTTDAQTTSAEIVSFVYTGTTISVFLNGNSTSLSNTALATAACTLTTAAIGGTPAFSDIGSFDVAELAVYSAALSSSDRQLVESYMKNQHGM